MWQDTVIMAVTILVAVSLIPSIASKDKPSKLTSLLTGVCLSTLSGTYGTLGLWRSMGTTALVALLWFVLLVQKVLIERRQRGKVAS